LWLAGLLYSDREPHGSGHSERETDIGRIQRPMSAGQGHVADLLQLQALQHQQAFPHLHHDPPTIRHV